MGGGDRRKRGVNSVFPRKEKGKKRERGGEIMKNLRKNVMLLLRRKGRKGGERQTEEHPSSKNIQKGIPLSDRFSGFSSLERQRCTEGTFYITSPPPWFSARQGVCLGVLGLVRPSLSAPMCKRFLGRAAVKCKGWLGCHFLSLPLLRIWAADKGTR